MPEFDIVVPHYGKPSLLRETVRSVQKQRGGGWRLTVVDDGGHGTDLQGWFAALEDPRIRYLRNERNLGITRNFNRCLALAERPYTVLPGNDDLLLPGYLETVSDALRRFPDADMVQPGVSVVDGGGAVVEPLGDRVKRWSRPGGGPVLLGGERLTASLMRGNWLYFPSLCWRTEVAQRIGFREEFSVVQDLALVTEILLDGGRLALHPGVGFHYRRHAASVSSAQAVDGRRFAEERRYFLETAERLRERGWRRAERAARRHLTSRLHALTLVPTAVSSSREALPGLLRHAFS